jgi:hypothetical protein
LVVADAAASLQEALDCALRHACPRAQLTIAVIAPGRPPFVAFAPIDVLAVERDGERWAADLARSVIGRCPATMSVRHLALPDGDCRRLRELAEQLAAEVVVLRVASRRLRQRWARQGSGWALDERELAETPPAAASLGSQPVGLPT